MITRIFKVTDTWTLMYFLVTMFEPIDEPICKEIGISPGFKIANRMAGRVVDTFAGYEFDPDDYDQSIEAQTRGYSLDGTSNAFGLLLSEIKDIRLLPDTVDVEQIRRFWLRSSRGMFIGDGLLEAVQDRDVGHFRKCLYCTSSQRHIAIIDTATDKVVYDTGSSAGLQHTLPQYLWLPVEEGELEYLKKLDICWFMEGFIKPEE